MPFSRHFQDAMPPHRGWSSSGTAALRTNWNSHGPDVAVWILEHDVAPAMRKIFAGLEHCDIRRSRAAFRFIGIDAHNPQLDSGSAQPRLLQPRSVRVM